LGPENTPPRVTTSAKVKKFRISKRKRPFTKILLFLSFLHYFKYLPFVWFIIFCAFAQFHNLYSSPSIIRIIKSRRMRLVGHIARMGEKRNACRLLVGKPEGKRPLGRPRCRWVDNIKIDLREIGWDGMDWIDLA
jgi:hypothetical protein